MTWTIVLYGVLPLLVFAIVDFYASVKWAVIAAIACAFADIFITYFSLGMWDPGTIVAFVMIAILGIVTLRLENPLYVKLQPVMMAAVFSVILAYVQFVGGGIMAKYMPLIRSQLPAAMRTNLDNPKFVALMDQAVSGLILVFIVHGAWVAWAAYKKSTVTWLMVRGLGFWAVFFFYMALFVTLMFTFDLGNVT